MVKVEVEEWVEIKGWEEEWILGSKYGSAKKCYFSNRLSHESKYCWYKRETQCFNCKGFGHLAKDCGVRKNQQANVIKNRKGDGSMF